MFNFPPWWYPFKKAVQVVFLLALGVGAIAHYMITAQPAADVQQLASLVNGH